MRIHSIFTGIQGVYRFVTGSLPSMGSGVNNLASRTSSAFNANPPADPPVENRPPRPADPPTPLINRVTAPKHYKQSMAQLAKKLDTSPESAITEKNLNFTPLWQTFTDLVSRRAIVVLANSFTGTVLSESKILSTINAIDRSTTPDMPGISLWEAYQIEVFEKYPKFTGSLLAKTGQYILYAWRYCVAWTIFHFAAPICKITIEEFFNNIDKARQMRLEVSKGKKLSKESSAEKAEAIDQIDLCITKVLEGVKDHYLQTLENLEQFKTATDTHGDFDAFVQKRLQTIKGTPRKELIKKLSNAIAKFLPEFSFWSKWNNSPQLFKRIIGFLMRLLEYIPMSILRYIFRVWVLPGLVEQGLEIGVNKAKTTPAQSALLQTLTRLIQNLAEKRENYLKHKNVRRESGQTSPTTYLKQEHRLLLNTIAQSMSSFINSWDRRFSKAALKSKTPSWLKDIRRKSEEAPDIQLQGLALRCEDLITLIVNQQQEQNIFSLFTQLLLLVSDPGNLNTLCFNLVTNVTDYLKNTEKDEPAIEQVESDWSKAMTRLTELTLMENLVRLLGTSKKENKEITELDEILEGAKKRACAQLGSLVGKYFEQLKTLILDIGPNITSLLNNFPEMSDDGAPDQKILQINRLVANINTYLESIDRFVPYLEIPNTLEGPVTV
ncbi:MAG: hypothetical protein AAGI90_07200, partial [Chlamydiota bacterium]